MLGQGVRRRTHCALRAPLKQLRQVSARSACVLRHTHAHPALRFSARAEGNPQPDIHSGHCCARPRLRGARRLRTEDRAERSKGPCGCSAVRLFGCLDVWMFGCSAIHPLLAAPAAGRLRGEHGRLRVHASSSDSPWLSERRAPAQSEFHGAPRNRSDAGLPRSEAKGSQTGGRPFFGDFLSAKRKKVTRTPGDSRPPPSTKARLSNKHAPASTSSARTGSGKSKLPKQ